MLSLQNRISPCMIELQPTPGLCIPPSTRPKHRQSTFSGPSVSIDNSTTLKFCPASEQLRGSMDCFTFTQVLFMKHTRGRWKQIYECGSRNWSNVLGQRYHSTMLDGSSSYPSQLWLALLCSLEHWWPAVPQRYTNAIAALYRGQGLEVISGKHLNILFWWTCLGFYSKQ